MILKRTSGFRLRATSLALLVTTLSSLQALPAKELAHNRYNLFDPIYAFDDVDAHYVSPALADSSSSSSFAPSTGSASTLTSSGSSSRAEEQFKSLLRQSKDLDSGGGLGQVSLATSSDQVTSKTTPLFIGSTQTRSTPSYYQASSSIGDYTVDRSAKESRRDETTEAPHYWSGLENYYHKMRSSQQAPVNQPQQYPTYRVVQQEVDDSLNEYKPGGNYPLLYLNPNRASSNPAFLLPLVDSIRRPPVVQSDNSQYAPGISRSGGIGAGSILMSPEYSQQVVQADQLYGSGGLSQHSGTINYGQLAPRDSPTTLVGADGKVKYLEWRKLPELLLIQQQQQRIRHQEDTFGPWYDSQRTRESLQEEAYCGPRNYLNFHALTSNSGSGQSLKDLDKNYALYLSRLRAAQYEQAASEARQQPVLPVALSAGEYPSHMGLYNGSVDDDNFLCAATWIDERFALTLASCVSKLADPKRLMFRVGEWNLNRNKTAGDAEQRPMIVGQVDQVHVFPKYRNDSVEHNLALVRFAKPIDMLAVPYVWPACQLQSRNSLHTSSCWAPSRNVSLVEYFDASGEGETKERKSVAMTELPIRLIANNDLECQRETKVEFFNFQHPNYICSGDYRKSPQRIRLNNSETFGSGIYCHEGGNLSLVSIVHPIHPNSSSAIGYMDLSYYRPWMRNLMASQRY